jgi:putative ABC transport system permease protein
VFGIRTMSWLYQTAVVTLLHLRSLPQRIGPALAAAFGVAGVVVVMVAVLSIAEGFRATLVRTGSADNALVIRTGTDSEMSSSLGLEATRIIADAPGIARGPNGPIASAEMFVIVDVPKRDTGTEANVPLRGVEPSAFDVRDAIEIVEGRRFEPGRNELIVGVAAHLEFAGLDLGRSLRWGNEEWTVVGLFSAKGSLSESEIWGDVKVLQPAYRRENVFQSVFVRLESPESFDEFKDALTADPRVRVKVVREDEYYASQSELLYSIVMGLGSLVAALMGIAAIFGAINTMYSAVAARTREIATLRALGFGGGPVVVSVLVESLLLALAGGLVGGIVAYLAVNGHRTTTLNWQTFTQVAFALKVTPRLMFAGLGASLLMGLLGGLLPAFRAARVPVAVALREL